MNLRTGECAKRLMDIVGAAVLLLLLLPVLILIGLAIRMELGSPVFFRQTRPGRHGVAFDMLKFRTMSDARDADGELLPDQQRLNGFGRLLRSSSLDELPELVNVLRGDMSLVGPRPLLCEYLPLYSHDQARRHEVRPGITGWAQMNGRNDIDWPDRFAMDTWYVDNQSLALDVRILCLTLGKVVTRDGIHPEGQLDMPYFRGNALTSDQ